MGITRKKIFFAILAFIFIILTTFICSEIILRIYSKITPTLFAPKDKKYNQARANPNAWINGFRLNSKGFHDLEFSVQKKEGTNRILAIGDSFTFGVVPYENNFITLLEGYLNQKKPTEIINMGIPGLDVEGYLSILVDEGLELNPDMILLNLYIGNDLSEVETKEESSIYTVRFINYIIAYSKINNNENSGIVRLGGDSKENLYKDDSKTMNDQYFYDIEKSRFVIYFDNDRIMKLLKSRYKYVFKDINTINQICISKNIKLLIVLMPSEIQVDKNLQREVEVRLNDSLYKLVDSYDNLIKSINYSFPNTLVKNELNKQNIQYLDLLEPFQERALTERLYKPNDTHWNIPGNLLAAKLIYQYINKNN